MATWTYAFLPLQQVLLVGGEIEFGELAKKIMETDPRRFRDIKAVEHAVDTYSGDCLVYENGIVRFNKNARKYTRDIDFDIERSIQFALHESVPDMEKWQLYPFITKKNSPTCYLKIPWEDVPEDPYHGNRDLPFNSHCDYRVTGVDDCRFGCGVTSAILEKYGLK